ncbi:MAG: hypothetical protein JEY99_13015 [Spirochaetales bacterium]|nr:hypothetical protein [Spirochaetales bacterium]
MFLLIFMLPLSAVEPPVGAEALDDDFDGTPDRWETLSESGGLAIYMDTKGDGSIDYLIEHDEQGYKVYEAMDFNNDGNFDDYYYYRKEVLANREIDTNFDGDVDVWVTLSEGVYVTGYERDTDFDGLVDLKKSFGEN